MFRHRFLAQRLLSLSRPVHVAQVRLCTTYQVNNNCNGAELEALKFNSLRRIHCSEPISDRRRVIELQAWSTVQRISSDDMEGISNRSLAVILTTWAYFARYWENGREGPANPLPPGTKDAIEVTIDHSSHQFSDPDVQVKSRLPTAKVHNPKEDASEAPRQQVLDEIFE
eukprot:Tbor_TRINITY_DN6012_c0_g3::TRINITY_DN6012_c0_g3_i1::g.10199::m.10199